MRRWIREQSGEEVCRIEFVLYDKHLKGGEGRGREHYGVYRGPHRHRNTAHKVKLSDFGERESRELCEGCS